jgi:hypothetical protein
LNAKGAKGRCNWLHERHTGAKNKNEMVHCAPLSIIEKSDEVSEKFSI